MAGGAAVAGMGGIAAGAKNNASANTIQSIEGWITKINPHYGNPFFHRVVLTVGLVPLRSKDD